MKFTENDYVSEFNASSAQVVITKIGNNVGDILLRIHPLTFASYAQQPMPCEDNVVSLFDTFDPAEGTTSIIVTLSTNK